MSACCSLMAAPVAASHVRRSRPDRRKQQSGRPGRTRHHGCSSCDRARYPQQSARLGVPDLDGRVIARRDQGPVVGGERDTMDKGVGAPPEAWRTVIKMRPSAASKRRTNPSREDVARRVPSWLKATHVTHSPCKSTRPIGSAVASQILMVLSSPPEASVLPSGA